LSGIGRISRWRVLALAAATVALCSTRAPAQEHPASLNRAETRALIIAAARLYDLDPELLGAIATVESGGNSEAVSPKGAQGLMQLMPATAERFAVENPFDPIDNVLGAVRFINFLKRWQAERPELQGNLAELLAAYNAGEKAVEKYHGVPPYLLGGDLPQSFRRNARRDRGTASGKPRPRAGTTAVSSRGQGPDLLDQLTEIRDRRAAEMKRMTAQGWVESNEGQ
jgi:soluble lytic murein transglycosylase-like protein